MRLYFQSLECQDERLILIYSLWSSIPTFQDLSVFWPYLSGLFKKQKELNSALSFNKSTLKNWLQQ